MHPWDADDRQAGLQERGVPQPDLADTRCSGRTLEFEIVDLEKVDP